MEIIVEIKNKILGDDVFWRGPSERIDDPARETAKLVAKDGKKCWGMQMMHSHSNIN